MPFASRHLRLASLVLLLSAAATLQAIDSIYMQVPGMKGESTSKTHPAWIDVTSIQSCISHSGTVAGACEISISKNIDSSSTVAYLNLLTGKGTGGSIVLVDVCGVNGLGEICYYQLQLRNVRFTSAQGGTASGDNRALESWTMAFDAIKWTYTPRWYTGTPGPPVSQCWDFTTQTTTCP